MKDRRLLEKKIYAHIKKMDSATQLALKPFVSERSSDAWVRAVLLAYFGYFVSLRENEESRQQAKKALQMALRPLVPTGKRRSLDQIEDALSAEFQRRSLFFLGGMTGPYYGPYIWEKSEKQVYNVKLPGRSIKANVFFMHNFLMNSWMHFQTFGTSGTGGWVKQGDMPWEDGLYCVASAYDL